MDLLSIISFIDALVLVFSDNNFLINWDVFNDESAKIIVTGSDGIGCFLYFASQFAFYVAFASHIKYQLANKDTKNKKVHTKISDILAIICGR